MAKLIKPNNYNANIIGKISNYDINFIGDSDTALSCNLSKNFNISTDTTYAEIASASSIVSTLSTATYSDTLITQITSVENTINIGDFMEPPADSYNLDSTKTTVQNIRYSKFIKMPNDYYNKTGGDNYWYSGLNGNGVEGYPAYVVTQYEYSKNKAINITPNLSSGHIYCVGYQMTGARGVVDGVYSSYLDCIFKFLVDDPQPLDVEIKFIPLFYLGGNLVPVTINLQLI